MKNKEHDERGLLPSKNRFEFILETLQLNYGLLSKLSLNIFIFAAPLIVLWLLKCIINNSLLIEMQSASVEQYGQLMIEYSKFQQLYFLGLLPMIIILFIGLRGGFNVVKRIAFREIIDYKNDFKEGVKDNFIKGVFFAFLSWLIILATCYNIMFLIKDASVLNYIMIFIVCIMALIFFTVILFSMAQMVVYKNTMSNILKNSFIFTIKKLYFSLPLTILIISPIILISVFSLSIVSLITIILLSLFLFATIILIFTVYAHSVFDENINSIYFKELMNKWKESQV